MSGVDFPERNFQKMFDQPLCIGCHRDGGKPALAESGLFEGVADGARRDIADCNGASPLDHAALAKLLQ